MPDIWMDVDAALSEVPVNVLPLIDDTDFKSIEDSVVYNATGMDLNWNFVASDGTFTQTNVTPTASGTHDWTNQGNGMYTLEIPASGGTISNDTEGFGWFNGVCDGVLPWRGPVIGFRHSYHNVMTASWFNIVADYIIRRNLVNVEASSYGDTEDFQSLEGAIAKLVNDLIPSGSDILVKKTNGVDNLGSQAMTTSTSTERIIQVETN